MEQEQEELFRQFNLIQETRAIESVRPIRHKFVDETEVSNTSFQPHARHRNRADVRALCSLWSSTQTAGHGLLGEMSPVMLVAHSTQPCWQATCSGVLPSRS